MLSTSSSRLRADATLVTPLQQAVSAQPPPTRIGKLRSLLPLVVSACLLAALASTHDLEAVAAAFRDAALGRYLVLLLLLTTIMLVGDTIFMALTFRWLTGVGDLGTMVRIRGASYLLAIVGIFAGMGGLVLYMKRRFGVPMARSSGIMLLELLTEVGSLGTLALLAGLVISTAPAQAATPIQGALAVGAAAVVFYLLCFGLSRVSRLRGKASRGSTLDVFHELTAGQFLGLYGLKLVQNLSHGVFIVAAMPCFGVDVPHLVGVAFAQVVALARGLPISAFGIGVDQLSFSTLFSAWDPGSGSQVLAFSLAYTFSVLVARGLIGLIFIGGVLQKLRESP